MATYRTTSDKATRTEMAHLDPDGRGHRTVSPASDLHTASHETVASIEDYVRGLERQREIDAARNVDELARLRAEAEHARARADIDEAARLAEMTRAEREADARAVAELGRLLRETRAAGERARVAAAVAHSGEARALRLERTRALNLRALVPVLLGFGAWSTAGVQQGAARLMEATQADPTWWALWALEPVLIGLVVWVIVARARLATTGGRMARGAERIAAAGLATSIGLNLVAALPTSMPDGAGAFVALFGSMLAHVIGPVGAAGTAYLIGVVDASVTAADPWAVSGAPSPLLADLTVANDQAAELSSAASDAPLDETTDESVLQGSDCGEEPPRLAQPRDLADVDIRERVRAALDVGEKVTGDHIAGWLGVSARTGRRRLARILADEPELARLLASK